jgi:hypothetical protein
MLVFQGHGCVSRIRLCFKDTLDESMTLENKLLKHISWRSGLIMSEKSTLFWDVTLCSLVEIWLRWRNVLPPYSGWNCNLPLSLVPSLAKVSTENLPVNLPFNFVGTLEAMTSFDIHIMLLKRSHIIWDWNIDWTINASHCPLLLPSCEHTQSLTPFSYVYIPSVQRAGGLDLNFAVGDFPRNRCSRCREKWRRTVGTASSHYLLISLIINQI